MATIYKRGRFWWVAYQDGGVRIQKSLKVGDEKSAKTLLKHYRATEQAAFLRGTPLQEDISFDDWEKKYLEQRQGRVAKSTIRREKQAIASLKTAIKKRKLSSYRKDEIETWFTQQLNRCAVATANCMLRHVKVYFNAAVEQNYLSASPCVYVKPAKETNSIPRVLTKEEVNRVLEILPGEWKDLAAVALTTGGRLAEVCRLQVKDVHFGKNPSVFFDSTLESPTKSKRSRVVPIPKTAFVLFERLTTGRPGNVPLVAGPNGVAFKPDWVTHRFPRYAKKTAKVNCTFHDLRRTYGAWLVMNGAELATVQANMGHSDISTTIRHYVHLVIEHRAKQTDLFPEIVAIL